jgi:hypothetical protein
MARCLPAMQPSIAPYPASTTHPAEIADAPWSGGGADTVRDSMPAEGTRRQWAG